MANAKVDVLLCPPSIGPAFRHGSTKDLGPASITYTSLFNLLAYPAGVVTTTSVRADETTARPRSRERMMEAARLDDEGSEGLPVGVQIVAEPGREDRVLTAMEILERGATWRAPA
jgi:Asp-tRNA(Asn)/Glu-tRNA(Gln) amidotransferase A subunit family amidase